MEVNVFWRHLVMTNKQMTREWRDISAGCFFPGSNRPTITQRVAGYELQMTWVIEFKAQVPSSGDTIHLRPRVSLPVTSERDTHPPTRRPAGRRKKKKFILRVAFLRGPASTHSPSLAGLTSQEAIFYCRTRSPVTFPSNLARSIRPL